MYPNIQPAVGATTPCVKKKKYIYIYIYSAIDIVIKKNLFRLKKIMYKRGMLFFLTVHYRGNLLCKNNNKKKKIIQL